jgi:hypothetical protein
MSLESLVQRILSEPSPDDLWDLHPHLLALESPDAEPARDLAQLFYCYLSCVRSKLTGTQYSTLAAALSASSVGVIALQDVLEVFETDRARAISNFLAGGLAASLETFSTLQHVKAWEKEFASVHEEAVWHLYAILWQLSVETQPGLPSDQRQRLIDSLMGAVRDPKVDSAARVAIVIRLFQVLLIIRLAPLWRLLTGADARAGVAK